MKIYSKIFILLMLTMIGMTSCQKDGDDIISTVQESPEPAHNIYATINGLVYDESETPLENVTVKVGQETTNTDENGFFSLTGYFNQKGANIITSKEGYFDGNGLILPVGDASLNIKVLMIPQGDVVKGASSEPLIFQDGATSISFDSNSYVDENDNTYNGEVELIGKYYDPTDLKFSEYFPGSLQASIDGERKTLQPFGLVNLELIGDFGENLDISTDATISMDIPSTLSALAPSEIPMWYLDTNTGLWIEDGTATKNGNQYVGNVSHFTVWVMGIAYETHVMTGKVTAGGVTYNSGRVQLLYNIDGTSFALGSKLGEDGTYATYVLDGYDIDLKVLNSCNEILHSEFVSAINSDTEKDIAITDPVNYLAVNGKVTCVDEVLQESYILVQEDGYFPDIYYTNNGSFDIQIEDCGGNAVDLTITGFDVQTATLGEPIEITAAGNYDIEVCEEEEVEDNGQVTITITGQEGLTGQNPRIIDNCSVTITETTENGLPETIYEFVFVDTYADNNVQGASALYTYKYSHIQDDQSDYEEILASLLLETESMTDNVPFNYWLTIIPPGGITNPTDTEEKVAYYTDSDITDGFVNLVFTGQSTVLIGNTQSFDPATSIESDLTLEIRAKIQ